MLQGVNVVGPPMLYRNRFLAILLATSYLLVVATSARFHRHGEHDEDQPQRPGFAASHAGDEHDCSVCQFLAQKPAPLAAVAPADNRDLVQEVVAPSLPRHFCVLFSAWQSRAPPVSA